MKRAKKASVIANKVANYDCDDDDTRSVSSRLSRFSLSSKRSTRSTRSTRSMLYFEKTKEKKKNKSKSSLGGELIKVPAFELPVAAITIVEEEQEDRRGDEVSILQENSFDTATAATKPRVPRQPTRSNQNVIRKSPPTRAMLDLLRKLFSRELTSFDERSFNDDCSYDDDVREQPDHFGDQPPASILGCLTWFLGDPEGEESLASHHTAGMIKHEIAAQ